VKNAWGLYILFWSYTLPAQVSNNPFDIVERLQSVDRIDTLSQEEHPNLFDVPQSEQTIIQDIGARKKEEINQKVDSEVVESYVPVKGGGNPFEVDHVPIRKRHIQSNAATKANKAEEQISSTNKSSSLFIFWFTLLTLVILAIALNVDRKILPRVSKSILNENFLKLAQREEQNGASGIYILLYTIFFINAASFIYLVFDFIHDGSNLKLWTFVAIGVLAVYMIRHFLMYLLSQFFPFKKEASLYNFTIITFNIFIGVVLIVSNLLLAYGPESIYHVVLFLTAVFLVIIYGIRFLRGLFIGLSNFESNAMHFLLYLCAFEFAPLLIVYKFLTSAVV
jgi:hypothetical protein